MNNIRKRLQLNNEGSTLVTVIVAIGFVTILAAMLLSTTVFNIRTKSIDRAAKDDFYYADKAVNDIYTKLGQNVQQIAAKAYEEALASVGRSIKEDFGEGEETFDFKSAEKANEYYQKKFLSELITWLNSPPNYADYIVSTGKDYIVSAGTAVKEEEAGVSYVRLPNLSVTAQDSDKSYQAVIATDIVIYIPDMNFFGTNADVIDYAIIANDGIKIDGDLTVNGNLYAGTNSTDKGGIKVNKGDTKLIGDYIISKGNVTVGSGNTNVATLTVGNTSSSDMRTNFWFDSLTTVKGSNTPQINVNANMFALNDLELNANESTVKISGNYYGYDDGALSETVSLFETSSEHSKSSAIIINGNKSKLTMLDVSNFILMGKAYITPSSGTEVATAEAVALKTNQQLYLVPPDFLNKPNPVSNPSGSANVFTDDDIDIPANWFGSRYLEMVGGKYVIQEVTVGNATYAFLKFNNESFCEKLDGTGIGTGEIVKKSEAASTGYSKEFSAQTAYIKEIMAAYDNVLYPSAPVASELRKRIKLSIENNSIGAFNLSNCAILVGKENATDATVTSANANVYARNSVVSYYDEIDPTTSDHTIEIKSIPNTAALDRYDNYPQNLLYRFRWLCYNLNPWTSAPLSKSIADVPSSSGYTWAVDSKYPFKKFISTDASDNVIKVNPPSPETISYEDNESVNPKSTVGKFILYTSDSTLNEDVDGFVICDGNLTVASGKKIRGTVIASGTITFEGGNEVSTNRGAIQKRIDDELKLVKKSGKYRSDFLISYLIDADGKPIYYATKKNKVERIDSDEPETEYTDYMFYENWQKGGR